MHDRASAAPSHPDAEYVGPHLIIDKTEWVPGGHPEPHLREDGQTTYPERYLRCLRCEAERLHRDDFPAECDADVSHEVRRDAGPRPEADVPGAGDG